jgi:DNA-binding MarR family transcriptional regulator
MSIPTKAELVAAIGEAAQRYQESTELFDTAAAEAMGLGPTDLRCLGIIHRHGSVSAGEVARETGLTRGATTTALDRVERAGYARRKPDPNDRRGVLVELTDKGRRTTAAIWSELAQEGQALLSRYTAAELQVVLRFLEEGRVLQEQQAQRLRDAAPVRR